MYGIQYGDQSFSVGYFSKEKLTLSPTDTFDNFLFGCGQNNQGLFGKTAGLLGLGRDPLSIVSQTSQKYGKYFSYCLPNKSGSRGHLTFGKGVIPRNVAYTPLTNTDQGTFYFVDVVAITVGGQQLPISQTIFKTAGTIVDSGTVTFLFLLPYLFAISIGTKNIIYNCIVFILFEIYNTTGNNEVTSDSLRGTKDGI